MSHATITHRAGQSITEVNGQMKVVPAQRDTQEVIHGRRQNKKAQLTLTNPRDAKACRKLLQFNVKTSCRQVNELFEVMQQPSAPSGE